MPARLRDLAAALKRYDVTLEQPSSGSHWLFRRAGYRVQPVPAGNGLKTELPDKYINATCKNLGIDLAEVRQALQGGKRKR